MPWAKMIASPDFRLADVHTVIANMLKLKDKLWLAKGMAATLSATAAPSLGEASDGGLDKDGFELP